VFWTSDFNLSKFVWYTSLKQRYFPPTRFEDLLRAVSNIDLQQIKNLPGIMLSVGHLFKKYNLHKNELFLKFIEEP
jgi:hypothetical protein